MNACAIAWAVLIWSVGAWSYLIPYKVQTHASLCNGRSGDKIYKPLIIKIMKKAFIIYSCLFFLSCNHHPQAPPQYYAVNGEEFQNISNMIRYESSMKKIRETQININLINGVATQYITNLTRIKYEFLDQVIEERRRLIAEINSINLSVYNYSELDTMRAVNGLVLYYPKFEDKKQSVEIINGFNSTLFSLDSLNIVIGLNK